MNKLTRLLLPALLFSGLASAQQIKGDVKDDQGKGLAKTTVSLLKAKDSSVAKLSVTDADGKYTFTADPGRYLVSVSHVGFLPSYSAPVELGSADVSINTITLVKATGNLAGVTVVAKKPMVEVKADKMILNVEGTINSVGQDALELLRKSPGVQVDKDDNISLSGKNGVQVYIDGRPTPIAGADLAAYLKTLQSSQIEAIEIITNPSARYDAAGNAGIINIRLKKNKSFGTNGSVNAGYAIGTYPKYNGGLSLNHRNAKVNLFGNYNYTRNRNINHTYFYRMVQDTLFDQATIMTSKNESHGFKAGMDYFVNRSSTIGVMVNGNFSDNTFDSDGTTFISYQPTNTPVKRLEADNRSSGKRNNINANVNYRYTDTSGRELNMDADYGRYRIDNDQYQPNIYFLPGTTVPIFQRVNNMIPLSDIDIYSFKTDYDRNFLKGRLGIGGKISYVETSNDFSQYDVNNSQKKYDSARSNDFRYKENINALYVNYNRAFKGFTVQAGLRMENTNLEGRTSGFRWDGQSGEFDVYDTTFKRHYTNLFPSAGITFNKNPMNQWSITVTRRIDRPAYQNLNPFEFKLDEYTYQKGNTDLRPQYTTSIGVTNSYKFKLTSTLNYSHVSDVFSQIIDTADRSKSFITQKNLAQQDIVSLNISYPFMYKKFMAFLNLNSYYTHYEADFGVGRKVNLDAFAYNFYGQMTYKLTKTLTAELSGWYASPSIWQGTFESRGMGGIDGGFQQVIFKGKGNLKLSVSDIFKTMRWYGESNFAGQFLRANGNWESRQFKINFTYRFGSSQVKAARQRKTGAEDESNRVGGGTQGGGIAP